MKIIFYHWFITMFSIFFYICLSIFYLCTGISLFNLFLKFENKLKYTLHIHMYLCERRLFNQSIFLSIYSYISIIFFFNSYTNFNILHMFIHVLSIIFLKNIYLSWVFFFFFTIGCGRIWDTKAINSFPQPIISSKHHQISG